jgi:predicted transcriptional regulator
MTSNDIAWEEVFEKHDVLNELRKNDTFSIKTATLKKIRDPRLMAKFDYSKNLPTIFKNNKLSILPASRNEYIIGTFEAYHQITELESIGFEYVEPRLDLESIDYSNINNEAIALNCAYLHNIIMDFVDEDYLLPTISGRMGSGEFQFYIKNSIDSKKYFSIGTNKSQIEIDGGYEGSNSIVLVEAKNSISDDFLIRQLYFPYRCLRERVAKDIKLIFMVYSNGIYTLREYQFDDPLNYNSIIQIKSKRYSLMSYDITIEDIKKILRKTKTLTEPKSPFPQADSFERVINLCELLNDNTSLFHEEITSNYDFDKRQTDYYANAGIYLGLIKRENQNGNVVFSLTEAGKQLFSVNYRERQLKFVESILAHRIFKETLIKYLNDVKPPSSMEITDIMKSANLNQIKSEKTYRRRAQTVAKWIDWILSLTS